jgi:hypothetical protein
MASKGPKTSNSESPTSNQASLTNSHSLPSDPLNVSSPNIICTIPLEIIRDIALYLSGPSIISLARTNRGFYNYLYSEDSIWRHKCYQEFPWAFYNGFCIGLENDANHRCEYRHQSLPFDYASFISDPQGHLRRSRTTQEHLNFSYRDAYLSIFYSKRSFLVEVLMPRDYHMNHDAQFNIALAAIQVYVTYHRDLVNPETGFFHCTTNPRALTIARNRHLYPNAPMYKVVANEYRHIWQQACYPEGQKNDNVVLLDIVHRVQHPISSHIRFRRILEHLLPVDHRALPVSDVVHAHLAQLLPRPNETNPYLKPLSVGEVIEVQWRAPEKATFFYWLANVHQTPVLEGSHVNAAPVIQLRFDKWANTRWEFCYSRIDGVPNVDMEGVTGCIRRLVCRREQEQWNTMNDMTADAPHRWNQCRARGDLSAPDINGEPGMVDTAAWTATPHLLLE